MKAPNSRGRLAGLAIALVLLSIACLPLQRPTPIVLPAPSATPEAADTPMPDAAATDTPTPPTATATLAPPAATDTPTPPTVTATLAPPTATATTAPATATPQLPAGVRVLFDAGATDTRVTGRLEGATSRTYILGIAEGQLIDISTPTGSHLEMAIQGADGTLVQPQGRPFFRGVVPSSQDYLVTLTAGNATEDYSLYIIIPARITFDAGATTVQLETEIPADTIAHFVIRAMGGQTMTVDTTAAQGQIITIVYGADGTVLQTDHAGVPDFMGKLPSTQDYLIDLVAVGGVPASVTVDVTIPPPE